MVIFSCSLENVIPTCELKPAVEQVYTTVLYHSNINVGFSLTKVLTAIFRTKIVEL